MLTLTGKEAIQVSHSGFLIQKDTSRVLTSVELGTQEQMIEMNVQQLHRRVLVWCLRESPLVLMIEGPWRLDVFQQQQKKKIPHNHQSSTGRTSPNEQTQHKAKFDALFCKEWELQCECVGKLMNHCCVAKKTTDAGRNNQKTGSSPLIDTTQSKTSRDLDKGWNKLRFCIQILPVQWNFQWLAPVGSLLTSFII